MIVLDLAQGSDEWRKVRLGIPTASQFGKLITAKTTKPSSQADAYMDELLAEWALGAPLEDGDSLWMERGKEMEAEAALYYEMVRDIDTIPVGFVLRDDGLVGCSPDRLVGDDGLLEIKVPSAKIHMRYLRTQAVEDDYRPQVQGQLWICGRQWLDLLSFNPELPSVIIRCERDEAFIAALTGIVEAFVVRLEAAKVRLAALRGHES